MQSLEAWKIRLRSWGYEPIFCSVESKYGLDALQFTLREQTSVIVGPSGVGKSSLINALRSNQRVIGAAEGDNWFDSVGFMSMPLFILTMLYLPILSFVYPPFFFLFFARVVHPPYIFSATDS